MEIRIQTSNIQVYSQNLQLISTFDCADEAQSQKNKEELNIF